MFDTDFMKAIQEKLCLTSTEMANILGINTNTYNGRILRKTPFGLSEIVKIINFYGGGSKIEFSSYFDGILAIHIMIFPIPPLDVENPEKWRFNNRVNIHFTYDSKSQ